MARKPRVVAWRFVYLFFAVAIAARYFVALGPGVTEWSNGVGISLTVMLLWLFLTDVSHHIDLHPYAVFGLGWCAYVGSSVVVGALASLVAVPADHAVLDMVVVLLMSVTVLFVLGSSSPDVRRIFQDLHPVAEHPDHEQFDRRCERLGAEHGLTEREMEVFKLLARGRSKAFIAEELVLSENTIRGHSKHIYTKLGVHTRGELQSLLDG